MFFLFLGNSNYRSWWHSGCRAITRVGGLGMGRVGGDGGNMLRVGGGC
ncbi:hypothetical protein N9N41_05465 [Opitutales bacterium]|nr:hypothetical protein [Opitutales bacterium]